MSRDFQTDGFLFDEWEETAKAIRMRYAEAIALFMRTNRLAWHQQYVLQIRRDSVREQMAASTYSRILMLTQSAVIALERGMLPAAQVALRSAIEALFTFGSISNREERARRLIEDSELRKKDLMQRVEKANGLSIVPLGADEGLRDRVAQLRSLEGTVLSAADLARDAGLESWYLTIYSRLSWAVHATANDIESHLVFDEGRLKELTNEPEVEGQEVVWATSTHVLILALDFLGKVFPIDSLGLDEIKQRFEDLRAKT